MHALFVHPNFYSQFSQLAWYLAVEKGWQCTVVSNVSVDTAGLPFNHLAYPVKPGPIPTVLQPINTLQDKLDHMLAVYRALEAHPKIKPDIVIGHASFANALYLRQLYDAAFVSYFEYYPGDFWTDDVVMREEYPPTTGNRLGLATYNSFAVTQCIASDEVICPTKYQRDTLPAKLSIDINVYFDGVDTEQFKSIEGSRPSSFMDVDLPADKKVITYVSPGLESIRGFDVFMQSISKLTDVRDDTIVLIAGEARSVYGHEPAHLKDTSFRDHVLKQVGGKPDNVHFLGMLPYNELNTLFNISDVHVYLTVPYTLSWSVVQAMSAGCALVASDTAPVQEFVEHERHALLAGFNDEDTLAKQINCLLDDDALSRRLGQNARQRVLDHYSSRVCLPQLTGFLEHTVERYRSGEYA